MTIADQLRAAVERMKAEKAFVPDHKERRVFEDPPPPPAGTDPKTWRAALALIANPEFCFTVKFSEQQLRAQRFGADPRILEFERIMVRRMKALGVPMFGHCVMRSRSEQTAAFIRGVSKARAGESPHNYGYAVDLIHGVKAWEMPRESWAVIGHVGKELGQRAGIPLEWGGDWKFYDPAHWQIKDWETLV